MAASSSANTSTIVHNVSSSQLHPSLDNNKSKGDVAKHRAPSHGSGSSGFGSHGGNKNHFRHHGGNSRGYGGRGGMVKSKSFPHNASHPSSSHHHQGKVIQAPRRGETGKPEVGSVFFKSGSKKQNDAINLCNFNYGTHEHHQSANSRRGGDRQRSTYNKSNKSIKIKYNKEHYLQANCQFIVKAEGDYAAHLVDPDILVHWDYIEQIVLKTLTTVPSCPICLHEPKSAKITRCGHIYCWPCLLHYLALSDEKSRKCPICDDSISKEDLKSVVSIPHSNYNVGDEIEMTLMRRNRESLFALPVSKYSPEMNDQRHPSVHQDFNSYSKLLLANPNQVIESILIPEQKELLDLYQAEKEEPEACFIEEALKLLEVRMDNLKMHADALSVMPPFENLSISTNIRPRHSSSTSSEGLSTLELNEEDSLFYSNSEGGGVSNNGAKPKKPVRKENFYFYQSSDGQMIFLHGLNAKMLEKQYGDLEYAPWKIKGKILEKESMAVTEELRHKLRYLRHLPTSCNIEFLELDFIGIDFEKEVMDEFDASLKDRRRKRAKRARMEKTREKKIALEENKLMGKFPEAKIKIESDFHFPDINSFPPALSSADSGIINEEHPKSGGSEEEEDEVQSSFSYSKIIREGKKSSEPPIILRSESFPAPSWGMGAVSLSKSTPYSSWGVPSSSFSGNNEKKKKKEVVTRHADDDEDQDQKLPEPNPTFCIDFTNAATSVVKSGNKKKKRKGGGKVLMLASAPRPQMN